MAYPQSYRPILPPANLTREFQALQDTLTGVLDMLPQRTSEAPLRPRDGMIRLSLSPWWPVAGQAADRWVIYDGTTELWAYLD